MLGGTNHDFLFDIEAKMDEIFGSIDFRTLNLETSAVSGDDIGVMLAATGDDLGEQGDEKIAAAVTLMGVGDFGDLTGKVAFEVIDTLGLDRVLELDQFEGIIGSFEPETVGILGQNLDDVIEALDFEMHSDLLGGFSEGALNTLTPLELTGFGNLGDLLDLANSAGTEGIVGVAGDHLDAVLTRVGSDRLRLLDPDTFAALTGALPSDILGGYADDFQDAILDTLGVNLFETGGADFREISGGGTSFDLLADVVGTEVVNGEETFYSLLVDGSSSLHEGALAFFEARLFVGQ